MILRSIDDLASDLDLRRREDEPRPVVLLGAGASVDAGIGAMPELMRAFDATDFDTFATKVQTFTQDERYRRLARFLQSQEPAMPTPGYRALAALCAERYFDVILTTNLDPLLDDALAAARLWRRDYLLLVNGIVRSERLELLLRNRSPRVKVVKLHGDLFHRFMAWTPAEMDTFFDYIGPALKQELGTRDVLVIGHSLRDDRIRDMVLAGTGVIWYTHPTSAADALVPLDKTRAVIGADCTFERLLPALADKLRVNVIVPDEAIPITITGEFPTGLSTIVAPSAGVHSLIEPKEPDAENVAHTIDDLTASVFALEALMNGEYQKFCTAFVTATPHLIVADKIPLALWGKSLQDLTLASPDGRRFPAKPLEKISAHKAGPVVFAVPDGLKVPGLLVEDSPLSPGADVHIAVAAGSKVGVSHCRVRETDVEINVEQIGKLQHLASLDGHVTNGASGGPVVDDQFRVRGFIVAGNEDAENPMSFMYPTTQWAASIRKLGDESKAVSRSKKQVRTPTKKSRRRKGR